MNPQDNNIQFTGMSQNEATATPSEGGGKVWKIVSIISIIAVIGLAAGLVFFLMKANGLKEDKDDLQAKLNTATATLNEFKEATGVNNPNDIGTMGTADIDFSVFFDAMTVADVSANAFLRISNDDMSFIKLSTDGNFQIASFHASTAPDSNWLAYFYRALPDGEWTYSNFSGQDPTVGCADATNEEIAAFNGVIECLADDED